MLIVESHWGLSHQPFPSRPDLESFFLSEPHEEALARIQYAIDRGDMACVVEGDVGSGKTMISRVICEDARERGLSGSWLNLRGATDSRLRNQLAEIWGVPMRDEPTWDRLARRVEELLWERPRVVLALDDADLASPEVLESLRSLADQISATHITGYSDASEHGVLTLVATARTSGRGRLRGRLYDLADLKIELAPWSRDDVADFVQASLERAGGDGSIFDSPALDRIFEASRGAPREICRISQLAMLASASDGRFSVDELIVASVVQELAN